MDVVVERRQPVLVQTITIIPAESAQVNALYQG
jgi:hypothetical protein